MINSSVSTRLLRRNLYSDFCWALIPCLNTRTFTTSRPNRSAPPPPPSSGYTHLTTRRLIALTGPDTVKFLQGVITADIAPGSIPRSSGFYAAFLNAKGRVVNDVFIYPDISNLLDAKFKGGETREGERWLVEVDADEVAELSRHLKRYKLRAKVEVKVLEEGEWGVWQAWRDVAGEQEGGTKWTAHTIPSVSSQGETGAENSGAGRAGYIALTDPRAPGLGRRLLIPKSDKSVVQEELEGLEESTVDAYTVRRYLMGVAEGQGEIIRESALPQESNIDYMTGISYRKGCYVGQELTIRTHHTGVVRKRILPVMLYPAGEAEAEKLEYKPDAAVELPPLDAKMDRVEKEKRARGLGKFLSGIGNIGLGICRLDSVQDGIKYEAKWEVEGEGEKSVGVKSFVPSWHLKESK